MLTHFTIVREKINFHYAYNFLLYQKTRINYLYKISNIIKSEKVNIMRLCNVSNRSRILYQFRTYDSTNRNN